MIHVPQIPKTRFMKKKINAIYALFWALLATMFLSWSNNPPNGHTGAPPSNNTCSASAGGCHSGGTMSGNITLTGLPEAITPNTTYSLMVKLTRTNSTPQLGGFQATILDESNGFAGSFSNASSNSTIQSESGITYFEHNPAVFFGGGDEITYTVDWTSPPSGFDTITMFTAANFANGNGNTGGDYIAVQTATGTLIGAVITVDFSITNVICFGGSDGTATALPSNGGGGPYFYSWSTGDTSQSIVGLPAGSYAVTVTNGTGGVGTSSISITEPPMLTVAIINQTNINCTNPMGSATAQGSGGVSGYSYDWPGGFSGQTAILAAGSYIVTVTDINACTATTSVTIEVEPDTLPPVSIAKNLEVALDENGLVTISPSMVDGGSFDNCALDSMWLDYGSFNCDNLGENEVLLSVWDEAGNSGIDTAIVTVMDLIPPDITCPENIEIMGCNEVVIDYPAPTTSDNCLVDSASIISGLPSGSSFPEGENEIVWTAIDQSGNESTCMFTITVVSVLDFTTSFTQPLCAGSINGTATVLPIGGTQPYSYIWDDPNQQTTSTAIGLGVGAYTVTVTDSIGCQTLATIDVSEPAPLLITVDEVIPETGSNADGAISITVSGGVGALSAAWSLNGNFFSPEEDLVGLSAGTYMLQVSDENGCIVEDTVVVENTTSTAVRQLENRISVFPNPVANSLNIAFELEASREVWVGIYDQKGQLVLPVIQKNLQSKILSIDMSQLKPGLFNLKIVADEEVLIRRVVLNR